MGVTIPYTPYKAIAQAFILMLISTLLMGNNVYRLAQNDVMGNITCSAPVTIGYSSTSSNGSVNSVPKSI